MASLVLSREPTAEQETEPDSGASYLSPLDFKVTLHKIDEHRSDLSFRRENDGLGSLTLFA